jgi:ABC-2 type transport system permease protein
MFGLVQFHRGLHFDFAARAAADRNVPRDRGFVEALYRAPRLLLSDPLAALLEKELRSLSRTPRFRLVFLMGFSFGVLIWWPLLHTSADPAGSGGSFPILISVYALVLLAEAVIWNVFGFDRSAAQLYFSAPVPFWKVLAGKNLAALVVIVLEITLVMLVCVLVRLPMPAPKILEAYLVTLVICLYLLAAGNLTSLYYPRPVNPEHSLGRASGGKVALLLLLTYPVLGIPVLLAYAARFAFDSQAAFYGVLAFSAACGAVVYGVAMDSALATAEIRQERLLAALGESSGPVVTE